MQLGIHQRKKVEGVLIVGAGVLLVMVQHDEDCGKSLQKIQPYVIFSSVVGSLMLDILPCHILRGGVGTHVDAADVLAD